MKVDFELMGDIICNMVFFFICAFLGITSFMLTMKYCFWFGKLIGLGS